MALLYPFITLQALSLGLTISDVSLIYGVMPVFSIVGVTLVGKIL